MRFLNLRDFLETCSFQTPNIPVYANTTADVYQDDAAFIRSTLSNQIASSVLFVDEIEKMYANGAKIFIEVGPKNTLSKLTKRSCERRKYIPSKQIWLEKKGYLVCCQVWHRWLLLVCRCPTKVVGRI